MNTLLNTRKLSYYVFFNALMSNSKLKPKGMFTSGDNYYL